MKIALGLATILPAVSFVPFFFLWFAFVFATFSDNDVDPSGGPPLVFIIMFLFQILAMLWSIGLTIFYIVNVFKNERVKQDQKALWAVVLFLGSTIAQAVYWYLYIWREEPAHAPGPGTV